MVGNSSVGKLHDYYGDKHNEVRSGSCLLVVQPHHAAVTNTAITTAAITNHETIDFCFYKYNYELFRSGHVAMGHVIHFMQISLIHVFQLRGLRDTLNTLRAHIVP